MLADPLLASSNFLHNAVGVWATAAGSPLRKPIDPLLYYIAPPVGRFMEGQRASWPPSARAGRVAQRLPPQSPPAARVVTALAGQDGGGPPGARGTHDRPHVRSAQAAP